MKKRYHEALTSFCMERVPGCLNRIHERKRQTDNIVVWVTGLSTGAIALIVSQAGGMSLISPICLKITVALFLISVLSGVVFRFLFIQLEGMEQTAEFYFEGYCFGSSVKIGRPIEITESHTKEQIAEIFKETMGVDYDHWLKNDYLDRSFWVDHYNQYAKFWRESEQEGLRNLEEALAPLLGKSPEETTELFRKPRDNDGGVKAMNTIRSSCNKAYSTLLIAFALAIVSIAGGFIFK